MSFVVDAQRLGKRYRNKWALEDCSLRIPEGSVAALVGPNGAGKSTLLHLAVGLSRPTAGRISVLGGEMPGSSPVARENIAFVAQDAPLPRNLSVGDCLHMARNLNRRWDQRSAVERLTDLGIPQKGRVGRLSGGQKAQLALTIALAKRPRLLILDEPVASLDPLARHDFMSTLMASVTETGISVLLSSHLVSELDRVADYVVIISHGRLRLAGPIDDALDQHRMLSGPVASIDTCAKRFTPVQISKADKQASMVVKMSADAGPVPHEWETSPVCLEDLVLAYLRDSMPPPEEPELDDRRALRSI